MILFSDTIFKKLAKSDYFQSLVANKELGLGVFKNTYDYSPLQINFLGMVNQLNGVYTDIAFGEVSPLVMKDEFTCECYLVYKSKKRDSEMKERKNPSKPEQPKKENQLKSKIDRGFKWIFKAPKKD